MARYSDSVHRFDGSDVPVRKNEQRLAGWLDFDATRRARSAQQRAVPGGGESEGEDQPRERDTGRAWQRGGNACRRARVHGGDRRRESGGSRNLKAQPTRAARIRAVQIRLKTSVPLVPPKPNELEIAVRIAILRAVFGT